MVVLVAAEGRPKLAMTGKGPVLSALRHFNWDAAKSQFARWSRKACTKSLRRFW
jgi:hypothetical protein